MKRTLSEKRSLKKHSIECYEPQFSIKPRIISVSPAEIKGSTLVRIFQATLEMRYELPEVPPSKKKTEKVDYVVFEYCPDVYNPKWRICARVLESDHYFLESK